MCDKGGECPLQNQAMSNGQGETRFTEDKRTFDKPVRHLHRGAAGPRAVHLVHPVHPDVGGDRRGPVHRVPRARPGQMIGTAEGKPFNSYFSGNTVQVCPVGALTGAAYRFRSRPFDLVSVPSVCEHCASGCRLRTDVRRGRVMRRLAGEEPAVNEEWNCDKGRWAFTYATQPDRLTTPLVRDERGVLVPASWPHALAVAAAGLAAARDADPARAAGRRRADRRAADPGGRLRLREVRPGGPGHQRRGHARPPALGRGGAVPRGLRGRARHRRQLRRSGAGARRAAGRVRARRRVAHRVPPAAQGGQAPSACGCSRWPRWPARAWPSCPARCCPPCPETRRPR